ncbi:hypothetical protein H072_46 [Dactylellina haptotyla CBS 200.50]|uniref:Hydrophobin n=1 Tax=Dactylellina haptotyla (strain CBS 200.50) TaxID=1284197 RepID=S8ASL0_DACHA|nr:hypothetical protein H072_46 [Dactylellina haptotyla CBS 200.50]
MKRFAQLSIISVLAAGAFAQTESTASPTTTSTCAPSVIVPAPLSLESGCPEVDNPCCHYVCGPNGGSPTCYENKVEVDASGTTVDCFYCEPNNVIVNGSISVPVDTFTGRPTSTETATTTGGAASTCAPSVIQPQPLSLESGCPEVDNPCCHYVCGTSGGPPTCYENKVTVDASGAAVDCFYCEPNNIVVNGTLSAPVDTFTGRPTSTQTGIPAPTFSSGASSLAFSGSVAIGLLAALMVS